MKLTASPLTHLGREINPLHEDQVPTQGFILVSKFSFLTTSSIGLTVYKEAKQARLSLNQGQEFLQLILL